MGSVKQDNRFSRTEKVLSEAVKIVRGYFVQEFKQEREVRSLLASRPLDILTTHSELVTL